MPRERLKYVHRFVTRHGEPIWYFRRGPIGRKRLPDAYGSQEFMAAYNIALSGGDVDYRPMGPFDKRQERTAVILDRLAQGCHKRAKRNGWEFDLTTQWLEERAKKQLFRCAVTGVPFELKTASRRGRGKRNPFAPSIDRIDCTRGYTKDNVRLVIFAVNIMLADWGDGVLDRVLEHYAERKRMVLYAHPRGKMCPPEKVD